MEYILNKSKNQVKLKWDHLIPSKYNQSITMDFEMEAKTIMTNEEGNFIVILDL